MLSYSILSCDPRLIGWGETLSEQSQPGRGPLRVHCQTCGGFRPAKSLRLVGQDTENARRIDYADHPDIAYVRRRRICEACSEEFQTAELDERLVDELVELRSKVNGFRAKARASALIKIAGKHGWIGSGQATIPRELAYGLIRASAWWLGHPSGPVRAPKHADRMAMYETGWGVEFGANGFSAGNALVRAKKVAQKVRDEILAGRMPSEVSVLRDLRVAMTSSIFNHIGELYSAGSYRIQRDDLIFGVQSIDVKDGVQFLFEHTGLKELLALADDI